MVPPVPPWLAAHRFRGARMPLQLPTSRAFTLFEVLLVIGIMSILMAMAWPAFDQMLEERRLVESAAQLRTFFRQARRQAIGDSLVYRCDAGRDSSRLRLVPASDPLESDTEDQQATTTSSNSAVPFEPTRQEELLPEGIRVVDDEEFEKGPVEKEEEFAASEPAPVEDPAPLDAEQETVVWMPLAEFRPDGSATERVFRLVDARQRYIEVRILGLTGEVEIGETSDWLSEEQKERESELEEMPSSGAGGIP